MDKTVIGIVGEKGSGKGTFADLLKEAYPDLKVEKATFSDVIKDALTVWNLEPSRGNFINMMVAIKNAFGEGVLANAVKKRIEDLSGEIIIVDGMRWEHDLHMIKSFPKKFVLYITADPKVRYERTKNRGVKIGEANASFEEFMKQESAETETYIPRIASQADFTINNNGSLEEYKSQTKEFAKKHLSI